MVGDKCFLKGFYVKPFLPLLLGIQWCDYGLRLKNSDGSSAVLLKNLRTELLQHQVRHLKFFHRGTEPLYLFINSCKI